MSEAKNISKNTFFLFLSTLIRFAANMILWALIARAVGVEDFGKLTFAISFTGLFIVFADYGFSPLAIREIARDKSILHKFVGNALFCKFFFSALTIALICIVINLMNYPDITKDVVYVFSCVVVLYSFIAFFNSVFRGIEKMEYETVISFIQNLLLLFFVTIALLLKPHIFQISIAYLLSRAVSFGISAAYYKKKIGKINLQPDRIYEKDILRKAFPFGLHTIFGLIYFQIDTVMLSIMKGDIEVGYYQASMRVILAGLIISDVIINAFYPVLSRLFKQGIDALRNQARHMNKILFVLGIPFSAFMFIFSNEIIHILYGAGYDKSILIFQILAWLLVLRFFGSAYGLVITSANRQSLRMYSVFVASVVNIGLNLVLIPKYGNIGASVATVITNSILTVVYILITKRLLNSFIVDWSFLKTILLTATFGVAVYYFKGYNFVLTTGFVLIYIIVMYVYIFTPEEKNAVFRLLRRK